MPKSFRKIYFEVALWRHFPAVARIYNLKFYNEQLRIRYLLFTKKILKLH